MSQCLLLKRRLIAIDFKAPSLSSKPLQDTSQLNGRAYLAAGPAVASLHTIAVLQANQADLLKNLDQGKGLSPDKVSELHCTTDLAFRAIKQTTAAIDRGICGWTWLTLGWKRRAFSLLHRFRLLSFFLDFCWDGCQKVYGGKVYAAFKTFIPHKPQSVPERQGGPGPIGLLELNYGLYFIIEITKYNFSIIKTLKHRLMN